LALTTFARFQSRWAASFSAASVGSVLSALSQWSLLAWRGQEKRP